MLDSQKLCLHWNNILQLCEIAFKYLADVSCNKKEGTQLPRKGSRKMTSEITTKPLLAQGLPWKSSGVRNINLQMSPQLQHFIFSIMCTILHICHLLTTATAPRRLIMFLHLYACQPFCNCICICVFAPCRLPATSFKFPLCPLFYVFTNHP